MTRVRDKRESQALKFLMRQGRASAALLGAAATLGENGRQPKADALGFKIGLHFVKRGFATVDQFNAFEWVPK